MKIGAGLTKLRQSPAGQVLLVVLLVGLVLRLWGINFGLPFLFHNDEGNEVIRALQLGTGSFDFERISKGGYFYLLFVEYGILFAAMLLFGIVSSPTDFGTLFIADPTSFYIVGRATTAIIGTVNIYLVYRLASQAYSVTAGLAAAALLAANILHAHLSHYVTVDVPMTCLATAALYFGWRVAEYGTGRDYLWAAVFMALAMSTKIAAAILVVPLLLAHCYRVREEAGGIRQFFGEARAWRAVLAFVIVYVALTPGIVVNYGPLTAHLLGIFGMGGGDETAAGVMAAAESSRASVNLFSFYFTKLVEGMSAPVLAVCLAGAGYAVWARKPIDIMLVVFALLVYVVMSMSSDRQLYFPRYILPMMPVLAMLGGRFVAVAAERLAGTRKASVVAAVVAVLLAYPAWSIGARNHESLQKDTRAIAREWFDAEVADGATVLIEGSIGTLYQGTVPLPYSPDNIRETIRFYRDSNPGKARYFRMALQAVDGKTFNLVAVRPEELKSLAEYKSVGVEYFVLRPDNYPTSRLRKGWSRIVEEVRSDSELVLVASFAPESGVTPGPYVEVYRYVPSPVARQ